MKQENEKPTGLPENAFRPLKEGEEYKPLMSPDKKYPEVNAWSVIWGVLMAVLFSAASAYLGLKVARCLRQQSPLQSLPWVCLHSQNARMRLARM